MPGFFSACLGKVWGGDERRCRRRIHLLFVQDIKRRLLPTIFRHPLFHSDRSCFKQIVKYFRSFALFETPKLPTEHRDDTLAFALFDVSQYFLLPPVKISIGDVPFRNIDFPVDEICYQFVAFAILPHYNRGRVCSRGVVPL